MGKAEEFIKRGLIIGLAITSIGSAIAPATIVSAQENNTIQSMSVSEYSHKGSTGFVTNIKIMDESKYEYATPDYIMTSVNIPMNYVNPWYVKDSSDGAKAVKGYFYLGTVIYNDTVTTGGRISSTGYSSLSDDEKENYKDLKTYYTEQLTNYKNAGKDKALAKENAEKDLIKKGIHFQSKELPLIFELITGDKFDYDYWYEKGITDIEQYGGYTSTTSTSTATTKISQGTKSNFAKSVTAVSGDTKIVQTYKAVVNGEARAYIKGLAKGSTTVTVTTTLNDGKVITYKVKVTVGASDSATKYTTDVNPLSYAGYCMQQDGTNWLGYLSKYGKFFTIDNTDGSAPITNQTGKVDIFSVSSHPTLDGQTSIGGVSISYISLYKYIHVDRSQFLKDFVEDTGAYDMIDAGKSEYEVFNYICNKIREAWSYKSDNDLWTDHYGTAHHYSLELYLNGRNIVCADNAAIAAGIAECLGVQWYTQSVPGDVQCVVVLDGKSYGANALGAETLAEHYNAITPITSSYSLEKVNDVSLKDLLSGKVKLTSTSGFIYYKVSDVYEAGRLLYGAITVDGNGNIIPVTTDKDYGVLTAGVGDTRILTFHSSTNPSWDNTTEDTISFRYTVPYMEKAYFSSMKVDSTKQLNLVNSDWSDWTVKTSSAKVAVINTTGKVTIKGSGTATITLTSKSVAGLSIKVLVSTSTVSASTAKDKAGTFYTKNDSTYADGESHILLGNYMRIHD